MHHTRDDRPFPLRPILAAVALLAAAHLRGQCANSWQPIASGTNGEIRAMTPWDPDGAGPQAEVVVVGGNFSMAGGIPANGAASYDPVLGTWSALGLPQFAIVNSLAVLADGTLVASGTTLGASYHEGLARRTGSSWTPIVPNTISVRCLLPMPNGDLIVGGYFQNIGGVPAMGVARWDGANWSPLPGLDLITIVLPGIEVRHLARLSNGDIVAGGLFTCSGGRYLARWDGTTWTSINPLPTTSILDVRSMLALPNGGLVIGASGIRQWNGASWSLLGDLSSGPDVYALTAAPNGDLIAGGDFASGVARWSGTAWSPFGAGTASGTQAFAWARDGDLLVGGNFAGAGGVASPNLARVTTSCQAAVATYGAGCAGAGGLDVLSPVTLPWIGSTFRARAVGIPPQAVVLSVYGFTPLSIPFASVLPQALPGCTILMSGDLIGVVSPTAGAADTQIPIPDTAAIVGAAFHHCVVTFEVDSALDITAITNSNALTCTAGAF
jgi:hypothetical protein